MRTKIKIFLIIGILLAVLSGYLVKVGVFHNVNQSNTAQSSKIQVAASFYPLYYFASRIGGEKADIINITPSEAEPHDYEPTAQDVAQIEKSKLLILNGGGLEAWADNIRENLNSVHTVIVIAGKGLINQQVMEEGEDIVDPHVWLSPPLAGQMVDKITGGFIKADPENARYYETNAGALKSRLRDLDNKYRQGLGNCAGHAIITSHAAFGYLATTYHFTQVPIAGLSPDAEPSPRQLAQIAEFARKNNVKYIFFETLVSPKLSETLAHEIGAKTLVLNPIEGLIKEDLAQGKNYFTEMETNLANLQTALKCKK
jgi:zinc transport system substrate-binding protein